MSSVDDSIALARERDRHPLVLVALAFVIQAAAVAVLLVATTLDRHGRIVGKASSLGGERPIEELGLLLHDPAVLAHVGRQVALRDVPVHTVAGDTLFWVGREGERIPVLLMGEWAGRQPEEQVEIRGGDRVSVFGNLRRTAASIQLTQDPLLDEKEKEDVRKAAVFVAADNVSVGQAPGRAPVAHQAR